MMKKLAKRSDINLRQRWIYLLLGILIMMCLGTVYSWSVFRSPIEELFDLGFTQSGLPYMTSLGFYALFMFITGKYLDKYSPRFIITIGSILVALGWILSSYAPNIYVLTISYGVIIGAGVGIVYGAPITIIAKMFPDKRGLAGGLLLTGFGLSPLVTAPVAEILIENYGVTKTFLIIGITFGIIIPLLSYPFGYINYTDNRSLIVTTSKLNCKNDITTANMIKSQNFKGLYLNFIIGTMIGLMLIGITSTVGVELIKLSPKTVALLMSVFAIFNGIGRPIFGWLTDKLSTKKAMLISYGLIITAALLMLVAKEGSLLIFSIAFSIFWFNLGGWLAIAPTSTLTMYGISHYCQNFGVVFTAYGIGAIIGVLTSGLLVDVIQNYYSIFYFIIGLCIIGLLLSQRMIKIT
ncbi:MAG: OFA family MFS transporter [Mobilitalea sp.]